MSLQLRGMLGLGDASTCGDNPCGFFDYIYASDACLAYQCCVNPSGAQCLTESQGLVAGGSQVVGSATGQAVTGLATGIGTGLASGLNNGNLTSSITGLMVMVAVAFVVIEMVKK